MFQLQGGFAPWPPDQGLCPWTPLGAPPQDPRYRLALCALAIAPPLPNPKYATVCRQTSSRNSPIRRLLRQKQKYFQNELQSSFLSPASVAVAQLQHSVDTTSTLVMMTTTMTTMTTIITTTSSLQLAESRHWRPKKHSHAWNSASPTHSVVRHGCGISDRWLTYRNFIVSWMSTLLNDECSKLSTGVSRSSSLSVYAARICKFSRLLVSLPLQALDLVFTKEASASWIGFQRYDSQPKTRNWHTTFRQKTFCGVDIKRTTQTSAEDPCVTVPKSRIGALTVRSTIAYTLIYVTLGRHGSLTDSTIWTYSIGRKK